MKIKKNSAFTLIETMIALVISIISVGAIYYSYLFFKSSYQVILDKAAMSDSGRISLSVISRDLRNAGYKDMNFTDVTGRAFDRKIEHDPRLPSEKSRYYSTVDPGSCVAPFCQETISSVPFHLWRE